MIRRGLATPILANPAAAGAARRSYIDLHHHKFPKFMPFVVGFPTVVIAFWLFFLSCGSVWWESNRVWKSDTLRSQRRLLGTGYRWANEMPPPPDTIFKNLPDEAE